MLQMLELLERNNECMKALVDANPNHPMYVLIINLIAANKREIDKIEDDLRDMAIESQIERSYMHGERAY